MKKLFLPIIFLTFAHLSIHPITLKRAIELANTVGIVKGVNERDMGSLHTILYRAFRPTSAENVENIIKTYLSATDTEIAFAKDILQQEAVELSRPQELRNPLENIVQLQVQTQFNNSCGYHAIANAIAAQNLYISGQAITSQGTRENAPIYLEGLLIAEGFESDNQVGYDHQLADDRAAELANNIGLQNYYVLNQKDYRYITDPDVPDIYISYKIDNPLTLEQTEEEYKTMVKNAVLQNPLTIFLCCSGAHWVTFVIIKEPNKNVSIFYMDSINTELQKSINGSKFAHFILNAIQ